jgi:hypothetical protein
MQEEQSREGRRERQDEQRGEEREVRGAERRGEKHTVVSKSLLTPRSPHPPKSRELTKGEKAKRGTGTLMGQTKAGRRGTENRGERAHLVCLRNTPALALPLQPPRGAALHAAKPA